MKLQTFLTTIRLALKRLLCGGRSTPPVNTWRGKYYQAYPGHSTVIRYPHGFKLDWGNQAFFISYEQYPAFRDASTAQIGNFRIVGDQAMWNELDIDIDLRSLSDPDAFPLI